MPVLINELQSEAIVGELYQVPVLSGKITLHGKTTTLSVPIVDLLESDDFGNKEKHYHIDTRFLSNNDIHPYITWYIETLDKFSKQVGNAFTLMLSSINEFKIDNIVRECLRQYGNEYQPLNLEYQEELQHLDNCVIKCFKCPHKGYNLNQASVSNHGEVLVCPMHGTRWNKADGTRYNKFNRKQRNEK